VADRELIFYAEVSLNDTHPLAHYAVLCLSQFYISCLLSATSGGAVIVHRLENPVFHEGPMESSLVNLILCGGAPLIWLAVPPPSWVEHKMEY